MMNDYYSILQQAQRELARESEREEIEAVKARLRRRLSLWDRLLSVLPFTITLTMHWKTK
jgi:hypothetical protein